MKNEPAKLPVVLIFMGVTGSGKTTVGALFAKKTGAVFVEGDDFHPPENIVKMRSGIALTDADREAWLKKLRKIVVTALAAKEFTVLTCSALKTKYRDKLAAGNAGVKFVNLIGPPPLIAERLKARSGHFMAPGLLESQLAILEPSADALFFSCEKSPQKIIEELIHHLGIIVPD
jgi:gluconokinase